MTTKGSLEDATEGYRVKHQENVTNSSLIFEVGNSIEPQPYRWALRLIFISVFLVGSIGNLVVCSAILRRKRMQTSNNIFTFNLALSDLLIVLIYVPTQMAAFENNHNWPFGYFGCQIAYIIIPICLSASIATLLAITSDRYRAIAYPMKPKLGGKSIRIILISIWVVSLLVALPLVFVAGTVTPAPGKVYCDEKWPDPIYGQVYWISIFIIQYILPLCIIWVLAVLIALKLRKNSLQMIERTSHALAAAVRQRMKQSSKITNMLIALIILYAVCMLPQHVVYLFSIYGDLNSFKYRVYVIRFANVFPMANSALNPIAYGTLNKEFKAVFKNFFKCECHKDGVASEDSINGESHFHRGRRLRLAVYRHVDEDGNSVVNYEQKWRRTSSAGSLFVGLFQRSKRESGREKNPSRESIRVRNVEHKTNGISNNNPSPAITTDSIINLMDQDEKTSIPTHKFKEPSNKKGEMEKLIPTLAENQEPILEKSSRNKQESIKCFPVEKDKRPSLSKIKCYDENDCEMKQCLLCSQSSTESNATRESCSLEWDQIPVDPSLKNKIEFHSDKITCNENQKTSVDNESNNQRNGQNMSSKIYSPDNTVQKGCEGQDTESNTDSTSSKIISFSDIETPDVLSSSSKPSITLIKCDQQWLFSVIDSVQETMV